MKGKEGRKRKGRKHVQLVKILLLVYMGYSFESYF